MTLKEFAAACRAKTGKNHAEFATAIGLTNPGSFQTIRNYEDGTTRPSFKILEKMADAAGVDFNKVVLFLDPRQIQTIEQENAEAHRILDGLLSSSSHRDEIIRFLRTFLRG